jgi:predicted membrane protein
MLTILDKWEKLNKDEIKKIFTEYRWTNEALLWVLRIIITINLWGMLLVTSWTLLTLALAISIIWFDILAVWAFADLENKSNINYKKNLLLDTINDIYPNIDENKFDRIKKALNWKNFNKWLAIISKQLKDSYSDKILSEDEIKKIEILLSKI